MDPDNKKYSSHVVTDFAEVAALLERDVPTADRARFQAELDAAAPYVKDRTRPIVARLQLAMLYIAKGDFGKLIAARELADKDWRDVLMSAEYPSTPPISKRDSESPLEHNERVTRDRKAIDGWRQGT